MRYALHNSIFYNQDGQFWKGEIVPCRQGRPGKERISMDLKNGWHTASKSALPRRRIRRDVFTTWNTQDLLRYCLNSVCTNRRASFRVCIVDDASSDGSAEMTEREFPRAQVNGLRGDTSIVERTRYDLWYVENRPLLLDVKILIRQLFRILNDRNAY
jgi:hypothetical protein